MDRQIVYPGSIPLDTDLLHMQRHIMVAIGTLARTVLGAGAVAQGFACTPTAGFGVSVAPGSLSMLATVDAAPFGSLPANPAPLMKIGVNPVAIDVGLTGPADGNSAVCWLIQATLSEFDALPMALPYYNAGDPSVAWSGPLNNGAAQATLRAMQVAIVAKPGPPQGVGARIVPQPDFGWVGLYSVMTYFQQPTLPVDIAVVPGGPFLAFALPQLTPGYSRQESFHQNTVWAVPSDVRRAKVRLIGAGGGGGGGGTDFAGGGGGAGGYSEGVVGVAPGANVAVTVGIGGPGGAPRNNGATGGLTSFGPSFIEASGGSGGRSGNPDSAGGEGGIGTAGMLGLRGGQGGEGVLVAAVPGGGGGAGAFGGGGRSAFMGGIASHGQAPGSGAAGGYGPSTVGGIGANGLVIVEY